EYSFLQHSIIRSNCAWCIIYFLFLFCQYTQFLNIRKTFKMHFTAKSLVLAAINLLALSTSADAYYDRSHYRRSVNDISGHPAYYHSEPYYYARPCRIYRRTKVDPKADNSVYHLKAHIVGGHDDKGPGHTTLFVTKEHSGKNTKHQAKQKPGTEIDAFENLTYKYDKQKMDPSISKHTPESLHAKALSEKKPSELHHLGTWKGKEAGKKLKEALTP